MITKEKAILDFKKAIISLSEQVLAYANCEKKEEINSFNNWILWTFCVIERAVMVSLLDKKIELDENGFFYCPDKKVYISPVNFAISLQSEYPRQVLYHLIQKRNIAAHSGRNIDKEAIATFLTFFKMVINWFLLESNSLYMEYVSQGVISAYNELEHNINIAFIFENQKILLDSASIMNEKLDKLLSGQQEIKEKLNTIQEMIEAINKNISSYQSLVEKQIELADSEEEKEHIIHAFSQECVDIIVNRLPSQLNKREYNLELNKLKITFGESAWNKMDESSKSFLISSKIMFNQFVELEDIVDYSGVCLLVTKALEVEISKRFCKNYIAYLKEKYLGKANYSKFPYSMIKYGKPLSPKHFTLGSLVFVMGINVPDDVNEEQKVYNLEELKDYAEKELFSFNPEIDVLKTLKSYAVKIDDIRERFRNPSAHTDEIKRINAIECFNTVVDIEKLLRVMLDSFDK